MYGAFSQILPGKLTSATEVRKWVEPLLAADPRLTLVGRHLILTPIRHILRGIFIDRTSDRRRVHLICHVAPLFEIPASGASFPWSFSLPVGMTDNADFREGFVVACRGAVDRHLDGVASISSFLSRMDQETGRAFGNSRISRYPQRLGLILASLGRLAEAREILAPVLHKDEARYTKLLASANAKLEKWPSNAVAKENLLLAEHQLKAIADLRRLQFLLDENNLEGVAALLGTWERQGARLWGVEEVWRPSPFFG